MGLTGLVAAAADAVPARPGPLLFLERLPRAPRSQQRLDGRLGACCAATRSTTLQATPFATAQGPRARGSTSGNSGARASRGWIAVGAPAEALWPAAGRGAPPAASQPSLAQPHAHALGPSPRQAQAL